MEYGTLVFVHSKDCICKYIIYKEDEGVHLVQKLNKIEYVGKPYYEIKESGIEKDIKKHDIEAYVLALMEMLAVELDDLDKKHKEIKEDDYYQKERENLLEQIAKLDEKEVTVERAKARQQLEKALKRKEKASHRDAEKDRYAIHLKKREKQERLTKLKLDLANYRRQTKKSVEET